MEKLSKSSSFWRAINLKQPYSHKMQQTVSNQKDFFHDHIIIKWSLVIELASITRTLHKCIPGTNIPANCIRLVKWGWSHKLHICGWQFKPWKTEGDCSLCSQRNVTIGFLIEDPSYSTGRTWSSVLSNWFWSLVNKISNTTCAQHLSKKTALT